MRTKKTEVLRKELDGMNNALEELAQKIGQAQDQFDSITILRDAVADALAADSGHSEEQLELPFPETIEFPAQGAN